ncbi:elongation factor Ts [Chloroflexota bacterium]
MEISTTSIKELRGKTGAGVMDCRKALFEAEGDLEKASYILKERSLFVVQKKADRATKQGLIEAYIHTGGRIGAIVEVNCETDFVARTDEFRELAHNLAMQVTAQDPQFISAEEVPEGTDCEPEVSCLLLQPFIKSPDMRVKDIIVETMAKVGENIRVGRFARFELGG